MQNQNDKSTSVHTAWFVELHGQRYVVINNSIICIGGGVDSSIGHWKMEKLISQPSLHALPSLLNIPQVAFSSLGLRFHIIPRLMLASASILTCQF